MDSSRPPIQRVRDINLRVGSAPLLKKSGIGNLRICRRSVIANQSADWFAIRPFLRPAERRGLPRRFASRNDTAGRHEIKI